MVSELIPLRDAAERLRLPISTIMSWCDQFIPGYAQRDPFGRRRVTGPQFQALEIIRHLRAQNSGDNAIKNHIQPLLEKQPVELFSRTWSA